MNDNLPDLELGVSMADFDQRPMLVGRVGEEQVLIVKSGAEYFAVAALCTHYHGHLVEGLLVDGTIRCPWHHACFDVRTGRVERGPALDPLDRWQVEQKDGRIFVRRKLERATPSQRPAEPQPESVVIVGGGAAGLAAALKLRRTGYQRALKLDPKHRGALEYLGELYLDMNQIDNAEKQLAALKRACPWIGKCEEYEDLKKAVDARKAQKS